MVHFERGKGNFENKCDGRISPDFQISMNVKQASTSVTKMPFAEISGAPISASVSEALEEMDINAQVRTYKRTCRPTLT